MRRREFIAGCCASAAWPLAARAQQHARTYRVGLLANRPIGEGEERRKAIIEVLAAHDFVEGRNLLLSLAGVIPYLKTSKRSKQPELT